MAKLRDVGSLPAALTRLDSPQLARVVERLAPERLNELIQHCGLHACGDLVTAARPSQLTAVLDLDLWRRSDAGADEEFDVYRFGEWLEVLADTDLDAAVRTIAATDLQVWVAGLSRYVGVFDLATFEPTARTDDEWVDALERGDGLECEIGGYLIRAGCQAPWDAIVEVLTALETGAPDRFQALMTACRAVSDSGRELDGLDELLEAPEQLLHDVTLGREERRADQGYTTPAEARAFLELARTRGSDPDSRAAGKVLAAAHLPPASRIEVTTAAPVHTPAVVETLAADEAAALSAVEEVLARAGLVPQQPRALLAERTPEALPLAEISARMAYLHEHNEDVYLQRSGELAFLANTLIAGCSLQTRPFATQEASDAVVAVCNLGLERWRPAPPDDFLAAHDLIGVFQLGWSALHREVSLHAADALIQFLSAFRGADRQIQNELDRLRRELMKQYELGTPWRAEEALEAIAPIDLAVWTALVGLLSECPVIPAAVTAILERRTGGFRAADYDFISTGSQIFLVRRFMRALPDMLSR
jgi:hypothetical protein